MSASHKCAAAGCCVLIGTNLFMCSHHWRMVPNDLKISVVAWYRRYKNADSVGKQMEALQKLRTAQRDAAQAVIWAEKGSGK